MKKWTLPLLGLIILMCLVVEPGFIQHRESAAEVQVGPPTTAPQPSAQKGMGSDLAYLFRAPNAAEKKAIAKQLQLTPEEQANLQKIDQSYSADIKALTSQYTQARDGLLAALRQPCPSGERVSAESQKAGQALSSLMTKEVQLWNSMAAGLPKEKGCQFWKLFAESRAKSR
ncbi:periplasmic heavy metal sensor [Candidatus Poribacteria bacterium]|nr:periplasmic heavy metal sensor [Candidatus Poribacteria bacterium]